MSENNTSCQTKIFYHGTSQENWEKIQKEGVLLGIRDAPSRCTYLATDIENAVAHNKPNEVILEVIYDPTDEHWSNNYFPDEWQHREYNPIPLELVSVYDATKTVKWYDYLDWETMEFTWWKMSEEKRQEIRDAGINPSYDNRETGLVSHADSKLEELVLHETYDSSHTSDNEVDNNE